MVSGVPRMCMRITPTPAPAAAGVSSGSNASPETSFTTAAPTAIAARATGALRVSTEIGPSRRRANCRSEEHTSELQSHSELVCRLLLEKKKIDQQAITSVQPTCRRGRLKEMHD